MIGRKWTGRTGALSTTFFAGEIFEVGFFEKSSACVKSSAVRFAAGETIKYHPIPLCGRRAARPLLSPPGTPAGPLCIVGPRCVPTTWRVWYGGAAILPGGAVRGCCRGQNYGFVKEKSDDFCTKIARFSRVFGVLFCLSERIGPGGARAAILNDRGADQRHNASPAGRELFASTTKADRHGAGLVPDGKSI